MLRASSLTLSSFSSPHPHPHHHHHHTHSTEDRCVCGGRRRRGYWDGYRDEDGDESDMGEGGEGEFGEVLVKALKGRVKGKGKGNAFSEKEVRRALRGLGREGRMRL